MAMALPPPPRKSIAIANGSKDMAPGGPEAVEAALVAEVERAKRDELSEQERVALADKLSDLAMRYLWHAKELAQMSDKLRTARHHLL